MTLVIENVTEKVFESNIYWQVKVGVKQRVKSQPASQPAPHLGTGLAHLFAVLELILVSVNS